MMSVGHTVSHTQDLDVDHLKKYIYIYIYKQLHKVSILNELVRYDIGLNEHKIINT